MLFWPGICKTTQAVLLSAKNTSRMNFSLLQTDLFPAYVEQAPKHMGAAFEALKEAEISTDTFSFYTSVSAIASCKIEGEQMEIDSYIRHKMLNIDYLQNLVEKPNDLYNAYLFAQKAPLGKKNFLQAHRLLSEHLLPQHKRGVLRTGNMVVMEHNTFRIQYEAAPGAEVRTLFNSLWEDIERLKKRRLSVEEAFFFASFVHLVFVSIHPFEDGNGRAGRLLEKWFLARMLGQKAWYVQSELYYYQHVKTYYQNLHRLGVFYQQLNYAEALPFLLMLAKSLPAQ